METGFRGTFVISWHQTDVEGQKATTLDCLDVGATWRWSGKAVRVDGPDNILSLGGAEGAVDLRKRAARTVRRLVGVALDTSRLSDRVEFEDDLEPERGFVVTDGRRTYTVTLIDVAGSAAPLLMIMDDLPPTDTDLWIVHAAMGNQKSFPGDVATGGVICFTHGTKLLTPDGPKRVEDLNEGDKLCTKDSGAQEIRWSGHRRMTGARLYAMPHLRPIRLRAGALGNGEPDEDLLVSPEHRVLLHGAEAQMLFNTPEVLVAAKDLINDHTVMVDRSVREVTYHHLLLDRHEIVWANGVETESFHPANASLQSIEKDQRDRLLNHLPGVEANPHSYGDYARRNLSQSDVHILLHRVA
ncbi:Hint domain-containing protein [Cochlodiniinecator piscidefendens]|uniref:Hint domain-containing protein n=1 Tax=Cochlodiniinecator piscidefendens TaxID=2715756 RepID=UPI0014076B42|nr:Hint domain-containing protein [Cochlodiniinecator piscidefendens]